MRTLNLRVHFSGRNLHVTKFTWTFLWANLQSFLGALDMFCSSDGYFRKKKLTKNTYRCKMHIYCFAYPTVRCRVVIINTINKWPERVRLGTDAHIFPVAQINWPITSFDLQREIHKSTRFNILYSTFTKLHLYTIIINKYSAHVFRATVRTMFRIVLHQNYVFNIVYLFSKTQVISYKTTQHTERTTIVWTKKCSKRFFSY